MIKIAIFSNFPVFFSLSVGILQNNYFFPFIFQATLA
jgi:hypothetical protein